MYKSLLYKEKHLPMYKRIMSEYNKNQKQKQKLKKSEV